MPNSICCQVHAKSIRKRRVNKTETEIQIEDSVDPKNSYILNKESLAEKTDVKTDLEKTITRCLMADPFFGQKE